MTGDPPVIPHWLVRHLLPRDVAAIVEGDLEESWHEPDASRRRQWRVAIASIAAWWAYRLAVDARPRAIPHPEGDGLMRTFLQDLAYGVRLMRRAPGFTAAVVLTLGVGIGANAATFGIVDVLSLTPLSYKDPERVAFVFGWNIERQQRRFNLPLADAMDIGRQMRSLADVGAYVYWSANLTGPAAPERIQAYRVTANTFALLGVDAVRGRTLTPADGGLDAPDVVVLSHGLWQRRFGASPTIIGQTITLDGHPHTIIGVMPPRFEFPVFNFKGDAWAPLKVDLEAGVTRAASPSIVAIARLAPGMSYGRAQAELDTVMRHLEAENPATNRGLGGQLLEMRRLGDEFAAPSSAIMLFAVGFVLLLACANVANLLLSRAVSRERELSVRAAIGAGRGRLVRQLLTESAVLSLAGAIVGLVLAFVMLRWLRASLPELLIVTQPNVFDLGVHRATLAYTSGLVVISALLFGAAPSLRTARIDLCASLQSGGHGTSTPRHQRFRAALLVAEVAMSLVLLVAAGLLVRTFERLHQVDPGFNTDPVLTMTVTLPEYRYGTEAAQRLFFERAIDNVQRVPGIRAAGFVNALPFSTYDNRARYVIDGQVAEPGREPSASYRVVTPDYFRALEIPTASGRAFDSRDRDITQPVAIVNRTLARKTFGDAEPIGRRLRLGRGNSTAPWRTIVGVVGDVLHSELTGRPEPEIYLPAAQAPAAMMFLAARTEDDPAALVVPVRNAISRVDPMQPVYHVKTMRQLVDAALLPNTSAMSMMTLLAALALLLATVGIYGVTSYAVSQQAREFGVRLALGAAPADVLRLVLRRGLSLILLGTAIGAAGALAATRALSGVLYGVTFADAPSYASAAGVVILVGALACYLPARRAMRLDPVAILRSD